MANWYDNVPAPTDRNGHEVPLDTRELVFDGERSSVMCYLYGPATRKWYVQFAGVDEQRQLSSCTLHDNWEQLEKDAAKGVCGYFGMDDAEDCKGCPAYRDRFSCGCNSVMSCDIVRRAKALAGVTDGD